jgi:acetolactate synthase-1/2/3 large subunit
MKLSDYVIEFLVRQGVKRLFLLPGGGSMHLVDSAGRNAGLEYVCCLHEQACAYAAEAYAEYTLSLGAALVTTGPGGTNAVTGLAAAWSESASCIFLSGQVKRADSLTGRGVRTMGPQEVDIVSIVRPITKYAVTVNHPETIRYHMEKAAYLATHGRRGPVWLDIPLDVQSAAIDDAALEGFEPPPPEASDPMARRAAEAIELLNRAERPVLFLGNGARAATGGALEELITRIGAPVLTTWKAMDLLPESHPLYAGRPGAIGQRGANFTQQNADCLLIVGARLDLPQTAFDHAGFGRAAAKILVDVDPAELAKMQTKIDVPVCGDASTFVDQMLRLSARLTPRDRSWWVSKTKQWQAKYPVVLPEYWNAPEGIVNSYVLVDVLSDAAEADDVLVPGSSGPCSDVFMQAFRVKAGQRVVNAPGLGAMGTGLPGSIGACLASGRRRTICVNGDGGFQLNIQDLETVRRLRLPIKYFILCNNAYASIVATQRNYFQGRLVASDPTSGLTLPDVRKVAAAYGIDTARIAGHTDLAAKVREVLERDGPVVCAVNVSPDQPTAPRVMSTVRPDGSSASKPMEDMWPFLDREEFRANMIVPPVQE